MVQDLVTLKSHYDVVIVCGPTAAGKSEFALSLAEALPGVIINADALQIYQEFPVLSCQPTAQDKSRAQHELYGFYSHSEQRFSVGIWLKMAEVEIASAKAQGKMPIVVGGSGLYIKALIAGLPDIPTPEIGLINSLNKEASQNLQALYNKLCEIDRSAAMVISSKDKQRIVRQLAVYFSTGKTLLELQKIGNVRKGPYKFYNVLKNPDRELLYHSINQRVEEIIANGAVEEVKLFTQLPAENAPKVIGFEEISLFLQKKIKLEKMIQLIQQKTRQYAKRQITWYKHQLQYDLIVI